MRLSELISGFTLTPLLNQADPEIHFVTLDSRKSAPGGLFLASPGLTSDGHDFIAQACERGISAIIVERPPDITLKVPVFLSSNCRQLIAHLAEKLYNYPSRKLKIFGITGTNGKTTTSFITAALLQAMGHKSAVIGTLGVGELNSLVPSGFTTPEAETLSQILTNFVQQNITHVVMEVSSHALATYRADGLHLVAAAFTNLSVDHLDFHHDMADYGRAKDRLFTELLSENYPAVLPLDHHLVAKRRTITWGYSPDCNLYAHDIQSNAHGIQFKLKNYHVHSQLIGHYNVDNILCAIGLCLADGIPIEKIIDAIPACKSPPGRLERVATNKNQPVVVVDFAHTPDALQKVIETIRPLTKSQLIVVMGCGGNRDKSKRPQMGLISTTLADYTIITSDNPRHEDPLSIINDIASGITKSNYLTIVDRQAAITKAIHMARPDDIILIAGKGHETTQQIGNTYLPFHDVTVASQILEKSHS